MKIKIFALLLCFFSTYYLKAQTVEFTNLTNLPQERSALTSASDGENIYVVNGFGVNVEFASDIYHFNISANSWSVLTNLTIPKRYATSALIGQSLYVFNGLLSNGQLNEIVEVIDVSDGSISFAADTPIPVRSGGVATWDNKIYTFGGFLRANTYSNRLYEFAPETGTWTELAKMPFAAETKGSIINGKLYVFGGFNGSVVRKLAIYDISTNIWEEELNMPVGVSAHSVASIGNKVYITGDYSNLNSLISFDTEDNSFELLSSNLTGRRHCTTEGINGQLFVIGGNTNSNIQSSISSVQMAELGFSTSYDNLGSITEINLFPNPTIDILSFDKSFEKIIVTNVKGQTVEIFPFSTKQISIKHLKKGVYYLLGKKDGQWHSYKWLKM